MMSVIASFLWCWHVLFQFDSVLSTHKSMNEMKSMRCICQTFALMWMEVKGQRHHRGQTPRARKGKPGGVASQESHALTGNPEMQHKRWPPLPGITRPKLCWFQSSTHWIFLALFFLSHPPRPPLPYRVVFGMVILTQIAIDRFGCEMNWSQDVLTRAVVHFRTTNAAACLRSRGFRSTLVSSSLAVCAMTAE